MCEWSMQHQEKSMLWSKTSPIQICQSWCQYSNCLHKKLLNEQLNEVVRIDYMVLHPPTMPTLTNTPCNSLPSLSAIGRRPFQYFKFWSQWDKKLPMFVLHQRYQTILHWSMHTRVALRPERGKVHARSSFLHWGQSKKNFVAIKVWNDKDASRGVTTAQFQWLP